MREKIYIKKRDTVASLMQSGVSRATAFRAVKRGYYWIDYHKKVININKKQFDARQAKDAANVAVRKYFKGHLYLTEDLVSCSMLRMYELSGISCDFNFQMTVARMACRTFLNKYEKYQLSGDMGQLIA